MIVGIGTDIVSIERIAGVLERHGERFVNRVLTPPERARFGRSERRPRRSLEAFERSRNLVCSGASMFGARARRTAAEAAALPSIRFRAQKAGAQHWRERERNYTGEENG